MATVTLGSKAEGSIIKLKENGVLVEFYIAKQNYESGLNGAGRVLVVRKDCYDHPYHLIAVKGGGSTVYGWVDAADIAVEASAAIAKGSTVKVKAGAKTYTGGGLASFVYANTYTVLELSGDRAVIGQGKAVTAAVNIKDLTLVG